MRQRRRPPPASDGAMGADAAFAMAAGLAALGAVGYGGYKVYQQRQAAKAAAAAAAAAAAVKLLESELKTSLEELLKLPDRAAQDVKIEAIKTKFASVENLSTRIDEIKLIQPAEVQFQSLKVPA